jgi:hypothetical protein
MNQRAQRAAAGPLQHRVLHATGKRGNDCTHGVLRRSTSRQRSNIAQVRAASRLLVIAAASGAERAQLRHQRRRVHRRQLSQG